MFKKILVPLDMEHDNPGSRALPAAVELANAHGSEILMIHIIPNIPAIVAQNLPAGHEKQVSEETKQEMKVIAAKYGVNGDVKIRVVHGAVYPEIIQCAEDIDADLIVMSSHRPGLSDYLLGSNSARVVRHSKCSVLVLR